MGPEFKGIVIPRIDFNSLCVPLSVVEKNNKENLPKKYIINKDATILFWNDGTKTIVKRARKDKYNKRLGFLIAYFQKTSGLSKNKANKYLDSLIEE